jgi:hypothetical protein
MVPVSDKISVTDLEKLHRRESDLLKVSFGNADPAISGLELPGQESPIILAKTPLAAHDPIDGDCPKAKVTRCLVRRVFTHLIQRQEPIAPSSKPTDPVAPQRLASRVVKIL